MTRELISKKTGTVFLIRPSLLRIMVLPAPRIREKPIQATEMQGVFCWNVKALSLQLVQITLQFPKLQGETGWLQTASTASQCGLCHAMNNLSVRQAPWRP
jgi:hypothetical protein